MNQAVEKFDAIDAAAEDKAALVHELVTVPETTLPSGLLVPSFQVGKYHAKKSADNIIIIAADGKPWHSINYHDARKACTDAGLNLITETQYLAIAYQITQQDENWTGGKVGDGEVFRGLHLWTVNSAQDGHYESKKPIERRWHVLANGERIYDISGNIYSWVFDDLHGDENGVINKPFEDNDPTIATAPYPRDENGMGWRPDGGRDWSGRALIRGGFWSSIDFAGVFDVDRDWPHGGNVNVGFRCTK